MTSLALVFAAALAASTAAPTPGPELGAAPQVENLRTAPLSRAVPEELTRPLNPRATAPVRDPMAPVRSPNMNIWWVIGGFAAVMALALYSRANQRQQQRAQV